MNADLQRIRDSRFFKVLPDRAFDRLENLMKVRAFEAGENVLEFPGSGEFSSYFGYIISGAVLFVDDKDDPLGLVAKDEFFLGRPFSINDSQVKRLVAIDPRTLVVFVPRDAIVVLAQSSTSLAGLMEEIYECVFERARLIFSDEQAKQQVHAWFRIKRFDRQTSDWVQAVEKRRLDARKKKENLKKAKERFSFYWNISLAVTAFFAAECIIRLIFPHRSLLHLFFPEFQVGIYKPGTPFNVALGIVGFVLMILTNLHTLIRYGIRKWKWKINYQMSQQVHVLVGFVSFLFLILHSSFHITGMNVANWAMVVCIVVVISGFLGHFISGLIPKTIQGDKMRLESLKEEQARLRETASLLMHDPQIYKTSIMILNENKPKSIWGQAFLAPLLWLKATKLRRVLTDLGLSPENAKVASQYLIEEFILDHKIRFLGLANSIFRRWMLIHKPLGYTLYVLGTLHVLLVTFFV